MRKFTADHIHDGKRWVNDQVLITDEDGKMLEIVPAEEAGEGVRAFSGLLCPGFINTHCHLELSHLKSVVPLHTGLTDFLITVIRHRNNFDGSAIKTAAEKAEQEMLKNGIVAAGDISNTTDSLEIKKNSRLYYHTFVECMGLAEEDAANRMQRAKMVYDAFKENNLCASIIPHAPYSVSEVLLQLINDFSKNALISIHNQESEAEDLLYLKKDSALYRLYHALNLDENSFKPTGKSSLQSWLPFFTCKRPIILVHNTYTSEKDIRFALQTDHLLYWCLCPRANLYIENKLPLLNEFLKNDVTITIGTDSLASNDSLSVLEEIKVLQDHFPKLKTEDLIRWATWNGACALNCTNEFGNFEKGKKPGIIWIEDIHLKENEIYFGRDAEVKRIL